MSVIDRVLYGGCGETRARLSDVLEGNLGRVRGWRVRGHLARCELCRAVYESLVRAVERLRSLGSADPAPAGWVADAVAERVRREPPPA